MAPPIPRAFWPVTVTAGVSDKIDFTVGASSYTATLAPGTYSSPSELAAAAEAALATAYPASSWVVVSWPSSPNWLDAPEALDSTAWTSSGVTVQPNTQLAPDGSLGADTIVDSTANVQHTLRQSNPPAWGGNGQWGPGLWAASCYAKQGSLRYLWLWVGSLSAVFDLWFGQVAITPPAGLSAKIASAGNGWWRCSAWISDGVTRWVYPPAIGISNYAGAGPYIGTGSGTVHVWGAKVEPLRVTQHAPASLGPATPGRITISSSSAFALRFLSGANATTSARDLLGFGPVDTSAATSVTGALQHANGWYPDDPVVDDSGDLPSYVRTQRVGEMGGLTGLDLATLYRRSLSFSYLPAHKLQKASEGTAHANEALERLFDEGWSRIRWYADRTLESSGTDYTLDLDTAKELTRSRLPGQMPQYAVTLKLRKLP